MTHWTTKRKLSLGIHAGVVSIPFGFSTVSAFLFWRALFGDPWIAAPMVLVIDVLALLGLVLFIAGIASPFVWLRHLLPFISIVPLGVELYGLLAHNGPATAGALTVLVSSLFVVIAWKCFETIERLFIDPVEAAREKAREQLTALTVNLARLRETETAVDSFMLERLRYHMPSVTVQPPSNDSDMTVQPAPQLSKTAQIKALAKERGMSESTVWRKVRAGDIELTEKGE